jgi:ribonuclease T1
MLKSITAKLVLTGILFGLFLSPALLQARDTGVSGFEPIALTDLPRQGVEVYRLIYQGGPFPHEKDGVVFGNRERLLPAYRRGYYREYTVDTPGARNRGGKRIVCGGQAKTPLTCYYTADHYASFKVIVP